MSIPCLRHAFRKPSLHVGRQGGEVRGSMPCVFLTTILGCFASCESLFFPLAPSNLHGTGLFFLCNPIADCPVTS